MATLRYFSAFILSIVFFTIIVSLIEAPAYFEYFKTDINYDVALWAKPFELKWLQGLATIMLSFNCQITFFYVRGEMRNKTSNRVKKVITNLILVECIFYLIIALSGYISLGSKLIPGVYTLRESIPGSPDYLMKACQFLFVGAAVLHIPITLFPSREQIYIFYGLKRSNRNHIMLTCTMTFLACLIPCVYPDIISLLGLLGGISTGVSGYVLPLLLKVISMEDLSIINPKKFCYFFVLCAVIFLCVMTTYISLVYGGGE